MEEIEFRTVARSKHLRITVHPSGRVLVTKPRHVSLRVAKAWAEEKSEWIEEARAFYRRKAESAPRDPLPKPRKGTKAYTDAIASARRLAHERLQYFNSVYGFTYGTVSIRNQKTRWGSCSANGNLSFNYRMVFLPSRLSDYLIVHELCHTKEHNHSTRFWALVEKTIPNYLALRKELRSRYEI